ncbi:MAG TPA: CaiB/BaiF CoA-transferase family protein [Ramlibacter sp.]|nr:CaiB/BaiF CoA-transferase family protein [Ramlibacter sp.]
MSGPLSGLRVIEMGAMGPGPFAAMMLADMGAEVIRVDRAEEARRGRSTRADIHLRGRQSIALDLKQPQGVEVVLRLAERADALIEGFRPGVMERLGLGPAECQARNPKLTYARMTGWGQDGPYAQMPGHDINYIAVSGALNSIGRAGGPPVPPHGLVGDFGGGGTFLAFGVMCAAWETARSGKGQVIDASMLEGSAALMTVTQMLRNQGEWSDQRGTNIVDSGAPFYDTYETADGRYLAVSAVEEKFYRGLLRVLQLDPAQLPPQMDRGQWPAMKQKLAAIFKTRTRDAWLAAFAGEEACISPVLALGEVPADPHVRFRGSYVEFEGQVQPAPSPRFSRTAPSLRPPPATIGQDTNAVLAAVGMSRDDIERLRSAGAIV